jgi:hypothetical protein
MTNSENVGRWADVENHYAQGLKLRSLTILDDDEIELAYEGVGVDDESFRIKLFEGGFDFDEEFSLRYSQVPGPVFGSMIASLIGRAVAARKDELPVGESYDQMIQQARDSASSKWKASQRSPEN